MSDTSPAHKAAAKRAKATRLTEEALAHLRAGRFAWARAQLLEATDDLGLAVNYEHAATVPPDNG